MSKPIMAMNMFEKYEQTRRRGMAMLKQAVKPYEVARQLGVAPKTVYGWIKRGDVPIGPIGRPSKLSLKQRARLEKILEAGPERVGYQTQLWTGQRIAAVIEREFGVCYNWKFIPELLRKWGWSCQKPRRVARERDEVKIEQWKRQEWPRIRKRRGPRA